MVDLKITLKLNYKEKIMTHPTNYTYHSTGQFRNVVKHVQESAKYKGRDEDGNVILDQLAIAPKIDYIGTTKLHGTNGSIILHEDGVISFHSKSTLLAYVDQQGEFTLLRDNAEFAQTMFRRIETVKYVMEQAVHLSNSFYGEVVYPIKVSGEWCGSGIQKSVGISFLPKKSFFIFGVKCGETDQVNKRGWLPVYTTTLLTNGLTESQGVYSICSFRSEMITIDFQNPSYSQNTLVDATIAVENNCPVATKLECKDPDGNLVTLGEGLVWTPVDKHLCYDSGMAFKTKGEKHSVSKVKTLAAICPEKLNSIKEFVDYAVTENRLQQGLAEVGMDTKLIGKFIGWVSSDVNKEEADTLEESNLTMKDVGKYLTTKAREWYITKLNDM